MQDLLLWLSQFLYLSPLSATLLRLVLGGYMCYLAYHLYEVRGKIAHRPWPIVGHLRPWMLWIGIVVSGIIGVMLIVGYLTQIAAIIAVIAMAKTWYLSPRLRDLGFFSRNTSFILLVIGVCLFMTGAGLYAFDLPLY